MYSEGPSTYEAKRKPAGHVQVQRPEATPDENKNILPSSLLPGKLQPQGHTLKAVDPQAPPPVRSLASPCARSFLPSTSAPGGQEPRAPTLTTNVFSRSGISRAVVVRTSVMAEQGMLSRGRDAWVRQENEIQAAGEQGPPVPSLRRRRIFPSGPQGVGPRVTRLLFPSPPESGASSKHPSEHGHRTKPHHTRASKAKPGGCSTRAARSPAPGHPPSLGPHLGRHKELQTTSSSSFSFTSEQ